MSQSFARQCSLAVMLFCLLVFSVVFYTNAWVVDDAYITFRTSVNLVNGYGLTWNVDERVQAYTNPFWMFLIALLYSITNEVFFSSLVLSYACMIGCGRVIYFYSPTTYKTRNIVLFTLGCISTKAVFDYTSSGLEMPLTYLLLTLFYAPLLLGKRQPVYYYAFIMSLAFFNRQDTLLLYIPAMLYLLRSTPLSARNVALLIASAVPMWGWSLWSLFYYGFLFPNTAYAKLFNSGIDLLQKTQFGVEYFDAFVRMDWFGTFLLAAGLIYCVRGGGYMRVAMAGVMLYLLHILISGGSATHMAGRLFAAPVYIAMLVCIASYKPRAIAAIGGILVVFNLIYPYAPVKMDTSFLKQFIYGSNFIDTKLYVHKEKSAIATISDWRDPPDHLLYRDGQRFALGDQKVQIGGTRRWPLAIGYFAYAAGPEKIIIDPVALSDPLLSRIPACSGRPGHFRRNLPDKYVESVATGYNSISDPDLRDYYDKLSLVIKGPLWSWERLKTIISFNLGRYDGLMESYVKRNHCR